MSLFACKLTCSGKHFHMNGFSFWKRSKKKLENDLFRVLRLLCQRRMLKILRPLEEGRQTNSLLPLCLCRYERGKDFSSLWNSPSMEDILFFIRSSRLSNWYLANVHCFRKWNLLICQTLFWQDTTRLCHRPNCVRILENETANFKLSLKFFRSRRAEGKVENETLVLFSCRLQSESSLITAPWNSAASSRDAVFSQSDLALHSHTLQGKPSFICLLNVWLLFGRFYTQRLTAM